MGRLIYMNTTRKLMSMVCHLCAVTAFVAMAAGIAQPNAVAAGSNGQQVAFAVPDGTQFTYLKIEGTNNYGKIVTWEKSFNPGKTSWIVAKWWWKGTLTLEFDVEGLGKVACVVDYVPEKQSGDVFLIKYYGPDSGCSSAGSAGAVGIFNRQDIALILEDYVTYKSQVSNFKLLKLDIDGWVWGKVYRPACIIAATAALPSNEANAVPLRPGTVKICSREINALNAILAKWNAGQLLIED